MHILGGVRQTTPQPCHAVVTRAGIRLGLLPAVSFALAAAALPPSSPAAAATLYGPEEFVLPPHRLVTVATRTIARQTNAPPFMLHLRNGNAEGSQRVTSAAVFMGQRLVLGLVDSRKHTNQYDVEVPLADSATLTVWLVGKPGSRLTISIDGTTEGTWVGPQGGTLTFPNGVALRIPPGALAEDTHIDLGELSCAEVDAIIQERDQDYASHQKRCIGGFTAKPEGLAFAVPIEAEFPVTPIMPGEMPLSVHVDGARGVYWPTGMPIQYDGQQMRVTMSLRHFSTQAAVAASDTSSDPNEAMCRDCATWTEACAALEPILPGAHDACCTVPSSLRQSCSNPVISGCACCKEVLIRVTTEDTNFEQNFASDSCVLAASSTTVQFLACPGAPAVTATIAGESIGCPKNMTFAVDVTPPQDLVVCGDQQLTASLRGQSPDGVVVVSGPFGGLWESSDPSKAFFPDPRSGVIRGLAPGQVTITASTLDGKYVSSAVPLTVRESTASILPRTFELHSCDKPTAVLTFAVDGRCGTSGLPACDVTWKTDDDNVVTMNGATARVVGGGTTHVHGTLVPSSLPAWCQTAFTATTTVTAIGPDALKFSSTLPPEVDTFLDYPLDAQVVDQNGTGLSCEPIDWTVGDLGVAYWAHGIVGVVGQSGATTVTATPRNRSDLAATQSIVVRPFCTPQNGMATCKLELGTGGYVIREHPEWIGTGERRALGPTLVYLLKDLGDLNPPRDYVWDFLDGPGAVVTQDIVADGHHRAISVWGAKIGDLTIQVTDTLQPTVTAKLPMKVVRAECYSGRGSLAGSETNGACEFSYTGEFTMAVRFYGDEGTSVGNEMVVHTWGSRTGVPLEKDGCPPDSPFDFTQWWKASFQGGSVTGSSPPPTGGDFSGQLGEASMSGRMSLESPRFGGEISLQRTAIGVCFVN